jgi:hypothetical protein
MTTEKFKVLSEQQACEIISLAAPKRIDEIEKQTAKKSVLNELSLPIMPK